MRRWHKFALSGALLYAVYMLVVTLFLTGVVDKRVVAAPSFEPYDAVPAGSETAKASMTALMAAQGRAPQALAEAEPLLPDLRTLLPTDLHIIGSKVEGTLRLKFTTTIWNAGSGPLETRGVENPETGELEVYQFFHTVDGSVVKGEHVGTFNYNHRHGHLHLTTFARYELWSVGVEGNLLEVVAENRKVGFCLMDTKLVDPDRADVEQSTGYGGCRKEIQGISVGYGDEYVAELYEQDLNVSHLPDGAYALVNMANPELALKETNYENNAAIVYLGLRDGRLVTYPKE